MLTAAAFAALALLTPVSVPCVHAQTAQQATLSGNAKTEAANKPDAARPSEPSTMGAANAGNVAAVDPSSRARQNQKSLTSTAIERVKEVAKSAGDIFSRVPACCEQARRR
jgi:hypothetical protein